MLTSHVLFCNIILFISISTVKVNNVCRSFQGYFSRMDTNPDCWIDADLGDTPKKIASNHGFTMEKHTVKTDDNYLLTTFRVKASKTLQYGKTTIFIQHGLMTNCKSFISNGNRSLAFILANQGYDVWLGNYRDSNFCSHESLSRTHPAYWNFSFHENGLYDLSASFRYIFRKTGRKIIHIGHSMGATGLAVYASIKPEEAKRYMHHAILLFPVLYRENFIGVNKQQKDLMLLLMHLLQSVNMHVMLSSDSVEVHVLNRLFCSSVKNANLVLEFLTLVAGPTQANSYMERVPFIFDVLRDGCVKSTIHYMQPSKYKELKMFDYGNKENLQRYNSSDPPSYNLSQIDIPVTLIYGEYDNLAKKQDIIFAYNHLKKDSWEIYGIPYNHIDALLRKDVEELFYPRLIRSIKKYIYL